MKKSIFYSCYVPRYNIDKAAGKELLPFVEQVVKYAKEDGLEGVEMLPSGDLFSDHGVEYAKKVRELLDAEGVECACYSYGISMLGDPKYALEQLKTSVDIAKELGSPYLHHTFQCSLSFKNIPPELTIYANAEKTFVELGKEVAYYAGEKGLSCIYEDQGMYVNTVERLGSLISKIDMKNTGVCLDIGNSLFYDVLPEEFAGAFASITKHVHVKDYILSTSAKVPDKKAWDATVKGNWLQNCLPGTGVVNIEKIFNILLSAGYDGYYSLENQEAVYNLSNEAADEAIAASFANIQKAYDRVILAK